jgi:hypothetical protein
LQFMSHTLTFAFAATASRETIVICLTRPCVFLPCHTRGSLGSIMTRSRFWRSASTADLLTTGGAPRPEDPDGTRGGRDRIDDEVTKEERERLFDGLV